MENLKEFLTCFDDRDTTIGKVSLFADIILMPIDSILHLFMEEEEALKVVQKMQKEYAFLELIKMGKNIL